MRGDLSTRWFAAGRARIAVRCPSTAVRDAVEAVFADLPDTDPAANGGADGVEVEVLAVENDLLVVQAADQFAGPMSPVEALATLVTTVSGLSLDADPERLHLHCAALELGGKGVLVSAQSGTGKTTLAAGLLRHGWAYLSDEAVALDRSAGTVTGFAKPLLIKPGGGGLLPHLAEHRVALPPDDPSWWVVPVGATGTRVVDTLNPGVIVVLQRTLDGGTDAPPQVVDLHPADAVVALMGQTMDAERFGPDAMVVLARLTARCRCVVLTVGPLDAAAVVLADLVKTPSPAHAVEELVPSATAVAGWRPGPDVRSARVGDRAVLHDTAGGVIAALDEAGAGLWLALHGRAPAWWDEATLGTPGAEAFLRQLESHGLVERAGTKEVSR